MKLIVSSLVALGICAGPAVAAQAPAVTVPSVAALRGGDFGSAASIQLAGYYAGSKAGTGILSAVAGGNEDSCMFFVDRAGHRFHRNLAGQPLDAGMCGVRCGGVQVKDGHSTAGSPIIVSGAGRWSPAMKGWRAVVEKAGADGRQIDTTIVEAGPGTLTLAVPSGAAGTGETVSVYPDDTAALDAAFAAANKAKVDLQLPAHATCGYANPGASVYKSFSAPALRLNGATLWLGHTGPTIDQGVGLAFTADGASLVGPGTISGLYQTDQGVPQFNTAAILFSGTSGNAIRGTLIIEKTKGRAFLAGSVKNFTVSDVTARDCGDFAYRHGNTSDDQLGRSMCGQVSQPSGTLTVRNLTALNAAQSGFLLFGPTPRDFRASIVNCRFSGNGYYGLDLEEVFGTVQLSGCSHAGNGQRPAGPLVYGGYIFRDIENLNASGIVSRMTDGNAFVLQSTDVRSNISNWSVTNLDVSGTTQHAGAIYLAFSWSGVPNRVALNNVSYDTMTVYAASPPCAQAGPEQQLLSFSGLRASGLYQQGPQTNFTPQGNPGQILYVIGRDSDLGTVNFKPLGSNPNAIRFSLSGVQSGGAPLALPASACR